MYLVVTKDNNVVYVTDDYHDAQIACYEYSYAMEEQCRIVERSKEK